ncbi:protein SMAX1-LIKE 3-like [Asparagus officinalis]|uniref:protein SMAX1-LIKE 3-like n=1 Tax=Asparagus officinalis TaxID=4686 RepID=UPI00098E540C|nr:protein SMAX1-LIKE 3-like [Asparagus officinalis]
MVVMIKQIIIMFATYNVGIEKGEVPEVLRSLQFITLPLFSFRNLGREEVERRVGELRCLVRSCCAGRGAVLYLGDLKWAVEYRISALGEKGRGYYCPVEHIIMEIRSLVCGGFGGRFWVMGIATYQTYMKCRLSLNCDSDSQSLSKSKRPGDEPSWRPLIEDAAGSKLSCCGDCSIKFENEARSLSKVSSSTQGSMITSNLPSWLQQYKEENERATNINKESTQELCKKWNSICDSTHKHQNHSSEITLQFSSVSPSSSSISFYDQQPYLALQQSLHPLSFSKHQQREHQSCLMPEPKDGELGHSSRFYLQSTSPGSNPKPNPNSTSSSDTMEMEYFSKFKELNAENLKILCNALEEKVSWQNAIIPEIASTILQCRSGMMRKKGRSKLSRNKEEAWLFFQGGDVEGKEKIARELANLVFSSYANFVSIELSSFSSIRSGSTEDIRNKRSRSEASHSYLERFCEAIRENPHRVFLVEDIEQVDSCSQMGIKAAIETGKIGSCNGEEISTGDAIIILSCESFDSRSRACSPPVKQKLESGEMKVHESEKEMDSGACLDLNLCAADEDVDGCSFGDLGLLESVDRSFLFKLPEEF